VLPAGHGRALRREIVLVAALRPPRMRRFAVLRWVDPTPGDGPPPAA
jgi:hypothetical protein